MPKLPIENTWLVVGTGVLLWLFSCSVLRKHDFTKPSKTSRVFSLLGLLVLSFGLYAGLRGPVKIGSVTLKRFTIVQPSGSRRVIALAYARSALHISRRPASGWSGVSKKALEYVVRNNGDRKIWKLTFRFHNKYGSKAPTTDITLNGPFYPRKTSRKIVRVPTDIETYYFDATDMVDPAHIVGAR